MAGTVDLIQRCYGGIETRNDMLHVNPCLPDEVHTMSFAINYRRQHIRLEISHDSVRMMLAPDSGEHVPITVDVVGERHELRPGDSLERSLR
jgi:trehalose/maltose hydrolase-like predicted phosphorylase